MRITKTFFILTLIIFGVFFISCSDDSSSTNPTNNTSGYSFSCTLNGGGFSNQTLKYTVVAGSIYSLEDDATAVTFSNATSDGGVVVFRGKSTGTFTINENEDDTNGVIITIGGTQVIGLTSGTIKVTTYGNVGGDVKGTFSGTAINASNGENVQVTNGSFSAKRVV